MKAVTQETNMPLAIAEAKGTGATAIKLYAQLDGELAKKISTEAHRQGLQVWSHADLTIASPMEVVNAGANVISHAGMLAKWPSKKIPDTWLKGEHDKTFWDQAFASLPMNELISAMQKQHTILDPTLLVYKDRLASAALPETAKQNNYVQWQIAKRFTQLALAKGIIISAGTDSDENKFVQREMQILMKDAGFTPMQALISATRNGALAIGIADKVGTIEKGRIANLVLLNANPVVDLANLEKIEVVIKNGKMINPK
jgi:imidazolonepropionase-like amidohydrolase